MSRNMFEYFKFIIICSICRLYLVMSAENIAFGKPATQSSTWMPETLHYDAKKAVDGNYDQTITSCAHGNKEENILNWFMVDLLDSYYISEVVILTPRKDYDDSNRRKYIYVGISNSSNVSGKVEYPVYPLCRQSPDTSLKYPYGNMSISCRPNTPPGRYVVVQQPTTQFGYLIICEFQVHGKKLYNRTQGNNSCQGNYYGDKCDKYCNCDKGVKCDQQGICPNGCDVNWEGEHCDKRKSNHSQLIGCFTLNNFSDYEFIRMNSISCIVTCSGYGFTFAADLTQDTCICTDTMKWTVRIANDKCKENCFAQNCQKLFYAVCPNGTYGYECTLKCNCLNNGRCSYMEGVCEDGCASGWTGASCDIRDCSVSNGACGENENCTSNSSGVTSCQCIYGYNRTSEWLPCESLIVSVAGYPIKELDKSAIIGGAIGSFAGLCLAVILITLLVKYRKRLKETKSTVEKPSCQSEC